MAMLALISIFAGGLLGLRFRVLILVPAISLGLAISLGSSIAHGDAIGSILLDMVLLATGLQLGYLGGAFARSVIDAARAGKLPPGLSQTSPLPR